MTTDALRAAAKLRPLLPHRVERWLRARAHADPQTPGLIDQQILVEARKRFGPTAGAQLLSLPPEKKARGALHLGTVLYESPTWPAGLREPELLQHLAIFGRSGAGKSNIALHLLQQLDAKRTPYLFLDFKRSARHLLPSLKRGVRVFTPGRSISPLAFNPFSVPPGLERDVHVSQLIDALAGAYALGDGVRNVLTKAIRLAMETNDTPTVKEVLDQVMGTKTTGRTLGWQTSALRALESLQFAGIAAESAANPVETAHSLLGGRTIIELDALGRSDTAFLVPMLLSWLYHVQLADPVREKLRLVVFIEEAHHVLRQGEGRSRESLMETLVRQCREVGIALVVLDQTPHRISPTVLANVHTSVFLNLNSPADVNKAAAIARIDETQKELFTKLPIGEAIVKLQTRWTEAFRVRVPLVRVNKGSVSDTALKRYVVGRGGGFGGFGGKDRGGGGVSGVSAADTALSAEELGFIADVLAHSDDGVKRRYLRLGMSVRRGMAVRDRLLALGYLERADVQVGHTRRVLLRVRREAREALGITDDAPHTQESLAHAFWKRRWAEQLRAEGWQVQVEAPRPATIGGRVDVLAEKDGRRTAVEVETGKSAVVKNVRRDLAGGYESIVVVATDHAARESVERALAETGLLIAGRVTVQEGLRTAQGSAGQHSPRSALNGSTNK